MKMMRLKGWLITFLIVCLFAGWNQITAKAQSNTAAPFEYSFQLDGKQYKLPGKVDQYIKNGWKLEGAGSLEAGESKAATLKKGNHKIELNIQNTAHKATRYQDCEAKGINVSGKDNIGFTIFSNIKIGMSQNELENKIGDLYYLVSYRDDGGTDYQVLDDLYFEEGYGYVVSMDKGVVTSIKMNYQAAGNSREEQTNEITDHWLYDPVKQVEPDTVVPINFNYIYKADMDQDGKEDNIDLKFLDWNNGTVLTVVNGTVNLIRSDTSVKDAYLIARSDGTCAILMDLDETDNYSPCCIYQILGTRCHETAEEKGAETGDTLTTGSVTLVSYPHIIGGGWSAKTDYKITKTFNLTPVSNSKLYDIENRKGIKVKKKMEVTLIDKEGKDYTSELEPGDMIKLTETDFQSELKFSTEDGKAGFIQIKHGEEQDNCSLYYKGEILTDYFDRSSLIFAG